MTRYRTISDGYKLFLQYLVVKKFLWFKISRWSYVYNPHKACNGDWVHSDQYDLDKFVKDWPDINEYFNTYVKRIEAIIAKENAKVVEEREIVRKRKGELRYF